MYNNHVLHQVEAHLGYKNLMPPPTSNANSCKA